MSGPKPYWEECVSIALDEAGLRATPDQIKDIAGAVEVGHENYGMAFYQPSAGEHLRTEIATLKAELKKEREKINCPECNGSGAIITQGPYHFGWSQCSKCWGAGRVSPR